MKITCGFKIHRLMLAAALFAGVGFTTHAAAQERAYFIDLNTRTATELGNLGGGQTRPQALNDSGQVVGVSGTLAGGYHAFITGENGKGMRDLGTLGGTNSGASGINNAGQVVGSSETSSGASHAFMTGFDGMSMRDLTASKRIGSAGDINDKGQVVGWFSDGTGTPGSYQAFITGPNGAGMEHIAGDPDEPGWLFITPSGINAAGQVAGHAGDPPNQPFITGENGVGIRDIGASGPGVVISYATGINDSGQVVGSYLTSEFMFIWRAYITGPDGVGMRLLGTPGESDSGASSVNDSGQVVGGYTADGTPHPFITGPNGAGMTDLNSLDFLPDGLLLTNAIDINNRGQIIATGVPEPETYAMLLTGLSLIGFMARRKRLPV